MLKVGIAGIGLIARDYIKLFASGKINGKLTALNSRSRENMENALAQENLSGVSLFTDYHAMLESGEIDAVIICTPHFQHPQMAIDALARGIHPLVEKPVGVFGGEADALTQVAAAHPELVTGVLYCRRMVETFQQAKKMIEQGAIGPLKRINWIMTTSYRTEAYHKSSPWRGTYEGEGGGVLMTQASHQLDLFLWLCGMMPERVHAFCYTGMEREIHTENDAMIQMEFPGGATGQFIASSREFPGTNRLELTGDMGQIIVENDSHLIYTALDLPEHVYAKTSEEFFGSIPHKRSEQTFPYADNKTCQAELINDFLAAIEQGETAICPVADAMKSLLVINAAYLSSWKQQTIEFPFDFAVFEAELKKRFETTLDS